MKHQLAAFSLVIGSLFSAPAVAEDIQTLTVAGGCFWCVESDFESVNGVKEAVSGFAGGATDNPTYKQVTQGGTGHYEAVQITYDADVVTIDQLLHSFVRSIDPTDNGGQFCDRGATYRTAIFVANDTEQQAAQSALTTAQRDLGQAVVTEILPLTTFFPAEAYHQDYYKSNSIVVTRRGPMTKANAYKFYRDACGRDDRVRALWGDDAPFVH